MPYLNITLTSTERVECDSLEQAERVAHNYKLLEDEFGCKITFDYSEFEGVENT